MTEKKVMKLASRGKRFGAACIDTFIPFISYLLYSVILDANGYKNNYPGYGYGNDFGYGFGYGYGYGYGNGISNLHLSRTSVAIMLVVFIILLAYIAVELVMFSKGKSIGKAALGLQVVSSKDGKPFRFWKMVFREFFVKSASGSVVGLGYIWILLDEKNRGWHDKILDSYVVDLKESEKMNLRRHLEKARAAAPAAEPQPATEAVLEEPEVAEPAIDITTEIAEAETTVAEIAQTAVEAVEGAEVTEEISALPEEEAAPADNAVSMLMKKEELLEVARKRGVSVSSRATKAMIIEAIQKATENVSEAEAGADDEPADAEADDTAADTETGTDTEIEEKEQE